MYVFLDAYLVKLKVDLCHSFCVGKLMVMFSSFLFGDCSLWSSYHIISSGAFVVTSFFLFFLNGECRFIFIQSFE